MKILEIGLDYLGLVNPPTRKDLSKSWRISKLHHWLKSYSIFLGCGGLCLMVELHLEGSAPAACTAGLFYGSKPYSWKLCKIDGVGPVDNKPSTVWGLFEDCTTCVIVTLWRLYFNVWGLLEGFVWLCEDCLSTALPVWGLCKGSVSLWEDGV